MKIRYWFLFISIAELFIFFSGVAIVIIGGWVILNAFNILAMFAIPIFLVPLSFGMYRRLGRQS